MPLFAMENQVILEAIMASLLITECWEQIVHWWTRSFICSDKLGHQTAVFALSLHSSMPWCPVFDLLQFFLLQFLWYYNVTAMEWKTSRYGEFVLIFPIGKDTGMDFMFLWPSEAAEF